MNSLPITFAAGFKGLAEGAAFSSGIKVNLNRTARVTFSGAGKMVYDGPSQVIAASGTLTLDLTTGLYSPLNEHINGTLDFAKIYGVMIEHTSASLATAGITAMGGAVNEFQGPFAAADKATLLPGAWFAFGWDASKAGWTVGGTNKIISIVNTSAVSAATVNVFLLGTV